MAKTMTVSGLYGVRTTVSGRFEALHKHFRAGTWSTPREAAIAYDRVVLFLGLDNPLNFPEESRKLGPASASDMKLAAREAAAEGVKAKLVHGFFGIVQVRPGRFQAFAGQGVNAGIWKRAEDAAIAHDRAVLHLGLARMLNFPERSRALGPASPEEMQQAAGREARGAHRYRGVLHTSSGKWTACFGSQGKRYTLGTFSTAEEAARAYDSASWNLNGDAGLLNFAPPDHTPTGQPPAPLTPRHQRSEWYGVRRIPSGFNAFFDKGGVWLNLGVWITAEQAAVASDRAELYFDKNRSKLNFAHSRSLGPLSPKELVALAHLTHPRRSRGYQGVVRYNDSGRWAAEVVADGRSHKVGTFASSEEAARARDRLHLHLGRERSLLNFPDEDPKPASVEELRLEVRSAFKETTSSQYRGVCYWPKNGRWRASIRVDTRLMNLGEFDSEVDAARAYDEAALRLNEKPLLNFPERAQRRRAK